MNNTYHAQMKTPSTLQIPVPIAIDHGLSLVHDLGGNPMHYLHEVSFMQGDTVSESQLSQRGYKCRCGYRQHGQQYWTWAKRVSLEVAR